MYRRSAIAAAVLTRRVLIVCAHAGVDFRVKFLTINGKKVKLAVW